MLPVADATRAVPTIGAIAAEHAANLLGVYPDRPCRLEIQRIRDGGGVDRDERGDANEHEGLRVEARCLE